MTTFRHSHSLQTFVLDHSPVHWFRDCVFLFVPLAYMLLLLKYRTNIEKQLRSILSFLIIADPHLFSSSNCLSFLSIDFLKFLPSFTSYLNFYVQLFIWNLPTLFSHSSMKSLSGIIIIYKAQTFIFIFRRMITFFKTVFNRFNLNLLSRFNAVIIQYLRNLRKMIVIQMRHYFVVSHSLTFSLLLTFKMKFGK